MKKKTASNSFEQLVEIAEKEQHMLEMVTRERGTLDSAMINAITEVVRDLNLRDRENDHYELPDKETNSKYAQVENQDFQLLCPSHWIVPYSEKRVLLY
ncbi:hypothetical protein ANCDUO_06931 [Ancylostoma duodenale]|uniref:Uncharacterized protein n=1 Tax=Ancylostoma duodenale TaxID=51022 RepID=A0A0C2GUV7_9BILA|nr:hypothetical protein ANCDUO_06931 [Ancylostoma duodenale]